MGFIKDVTHAVNNFIYLFGSGDMYNTRVDEMKAIQSRRDYREGRQPDMLKVVWNKTDDNVKHNIIGKAINQSLHLLLGGGVEFDLPGDEETPEEQWLNACWVANKKNLLLKDVFYNASDGRCGFVKINPTAKVIGKLGDTYGVEFPKLENINPLYVTMDSLPHDIDAVIRYTIQYLTEVGGKKKLFKQVIEHEVPVDEQGNATGDGFWSITDWEKDADTGMDWEKVNQAIWEYNFAPMIHFKNMPNPNDLWGMQDATDDLIQLQDKYNFNLSNLNKIIRYNAHPQTIGKGIGNSSNMNKSPDDMWLIPAEADISNLEMQSDLAGALEVMDHIAKSISDNMDAVSLSNLKDKVGQITNFAIRVLFYDALGKMQIKREIWEDWLTELNYRLLVINGFDNVDPGVVVWQDPLPESGAEVSQELKTDIEIGILSKKSAAVRKGYDWDTESERIQEDQANEGEVGDEILKLFDRGNVNRGNREM